MYSANTLQVKPLVKNFLSVIKQEKDLNIEVTIQSEVAFLTNEYRKEICSYYDRHDKDHKITHNHRKVPTVYCTLKFRNILYIHIISAFSSDTEPKYLNAGTQQSFFPSPGACIAYQIHRAFSLAPWVATTAAFRNPLMSIVIRTYFLSVFVC